MMVLPHHRGRPSLRLAECGCQPF